MLKRLKKKILRAIAPPLVYILMWLIYISSKKRYHLDPLESNFIAICWHGNFLMMPFLYDKVKKIQDLYFITSPHGDGDLIEKTLSLFKLRSIRGSTNQDGLKAMIQSLKVLKDGKDLFITPDGPKGPYHDVKEGAIVLSLKSKVPIYLCVVKSSKTWELRTWDRFSIPKPFCTIDYYFKGPITLPSDIEEAKIYIREQMEQI
ncbi:lysophospholipid acyltransferase family protein [Helicobacter sp. 11S02629-2]|uniref:lysophospholipid acyltransferase family protein n=1 Tax=Helicobacter sp. 11S02629-2 TaxID=1476195 RepID=UPI000BA7B675|nr:lysophospholipid acyltransferase family protein [Helicobacter sp. 11S02629-2]PAF45639.1 hypothetical protein BKH40_01795 [Helicobacter sp. 11S02629-2]